MLRPGFLNYIRYFLPDMLWEVKDEKGVYLTFDDGPTPGITERILDELAERDAKATFFCLGKNVELYPHLYERIIAEGHKAGNHSYGHLKGWGTPAEEYIEDVETAARLIKSDLYRPPYGRITKEQHSLLSEKYHLVMGDIVSQDYSQVVTPRQCLENVTHYVKGGSVIVFHDSLKAYHNMSYALPRALDYIKERGYEFKAIEPGRDKFMGNIPVHPQYVPSLGISAKKL